MKHHEGLQRLACEIAKVLTDSKQRIDFAERTQGHAETVSGLAWPCSRKAFGNVRGGRNCGTPKL